MAILLYCVAESDALISGRLEGVARAPVSRFEGHGLTTFVSRSSGREVWIQRPVPEAAVEFYSVLQELFRRVAIIPFRFPAIIETEGELEKHLEERAADYKAALEAFRSSVQLEVTVTDFDAGGHGSGAFSGTEYLRERQRRASNLASVVSQVQFAADGVAIEWRTRARKDGLRVFALVERELVPSFRTALAKVPIPDGLKLRVTGPWPPTEFLNLRQV